MARLSLCWQIYTLLSSNWKSYLDYVTGIANGERKSLENKLKFEVIFKSTDCNLSCFLLILFMSKTKYSAVWKFKPYLAIPPKWVLPSQWAARDLERLGSSFAMLAIAHLAFASFTFSSSSATFLVSLDSIVGYVETENRHIGFSYIALCVFTISLYWEPDTFSLSGMTGFLLICSVTFAETIRFVSYVYAIRIVYFTHYLYLLHGDGRCRAH